MEKITAKFQTTLSSGITTASTTATLTLNITGDNDNAVLPAGDYGFVIDENNSNREYVTATVSGTGLTFVKRGLSLIDGATEKASNKKAHRKGASIKITDHPVLAKMVNVFNGTAPLTGILYNDGARTYTTDYQVVDKKYVDDVAIAGGAKASTTVYGINTLSVAPASATEPIATGTNDPRIPSQDENDALVGTSGTPSTSNKFVTNADTATNGTASSVLRLDADSQATIAETPTADTHAASKGYVDGSHAISMGDATDFTDASFASVGTTNGTTTVGFRPTHIKLHYFIQGYNGGAGYHGSKGTAIYSETTLLANNIIWGEATSGFRLTADNGIPTTTNLNTAFINAVKSGAPTAGAAGSGNGHKVVLTISAVSDTGFTITATRTSDGTPAGPVRVKIFYEAYK